jgi:transposase
MTEHERGTDRLGRRAKRFLTPLQKYEIWLQLVRGETTIAEAADRYGVDRSTIMRLRTVAKDGALTALAESKPGVQQARRDLELEAARAEAARLGEALKELAVKLVLVEGKGRWDRVAGSRPGWTEATKSGLLDLLEQALKEGWTVRAACQVLEVNELRVYRWLGRQAAGELADHAPGGSLMHGLLDWEVAEIVRLFEEWGEIDRSHRKLAHRGSYLERVWVSPSSVRRVLEREGLRLRPCHGQDGRSASRSRTGWSTGQGRFGSTTPPTSPAPGSPRPWSRTWSRASGWPRSSPRRRPPLRSRSCSPTRWSARGYWSGSRPARTAWSTPPSMIPPDRCCWRSATMARR